MQRGFHVVKIALASCLFLSFGPLALSQQKALQTTAKYTNRYLVIATNRQSTLKKELDEAAEHNYRVIMGNAAHKILLLEKGFPDAPRREFMVVEDLHQQLNKLAGEGFRLIPTTVGIRAAVVERVPGEQARYQYQTLDALTTSNLQKDVLRSAAQGFHPVAFAGEKGRVIIMERTQHPTNEIAASGRPRNRYQLLATSRSSTLQKELNAAVAQGYRVLLGAGDDENLVLLEERNENSRPPEYLVIATSKSGTMEKELNEAARRGFRVLPGTMAAVERQAFLLGTYAYESTVMMEKISDDGPPESYRVIGTRLVDSFRRELAQSEAQGYEVLGMMLTKGEQIAICAKSK